MIPRARKYAHKIAWEEARRRDRLTTSLRRAAGIGKRVITSDTGTRIILFICIIYQMCLLFVLVPRQASV